MQYDPTQLELCHMALSCLSTIYMLLEWCLLVVPTCSDEGQFVSCFWYLKYHSDWRVCSPWAAWQSHTGVCSKLAQWKPVQVWKLNNLRSEWTQLTTACAEQQRCILMNGTKETFHIPHLLFVQNHSDGLVCETAWNNIQKNKGRIPDKSFTFSS